MITSNILRNFIRCNTIGEVTTKEQEEVSPPPLPPPEEKYITLSESKQPTGEIKGVRKNPTIDKSYWNF